MRAPNGGQTNNPRVPNRLTITDGLMRARRHKSGMSTRPGGARGVPRPANNTPNNANSASHASGTNGSNGATGSHKEPESGSMKHFAAEDVTR